MARFLFFGGVLALVALILIWDRKSVWAQVVRAASIAYIVLALILLILGLTVEWD